MRRAFAGIAIAVACAAPAVARAQSQPSTGSVISIVAAPGTPEPLRTGDTLRVTLVLDMGSVSPTGDVGALQLDLQFPDSLLRYVSSTVGIAGGAGVANLKAPGRLAFAFARTQPEGRPQMKLFTAVFVAKPVLSESTGFELVAALTDAMISTSFKEYPRPAHRPARFSTGR